MHVYDIFLKDPPFSLHMWGFKNGPVFFHARPWKRRGDHGLPGFVRYKSTSEN